MVMMQRVYALTVFPRIESGLKYEPGLKYRPDGWRNCANRGWALNTSRCHGLHADRVWQVCTVCASLVCVMHDVKLGLSVFWLPYSDPQSKPITNLLTDVFIVSVKYA